MEKNLKLYVAKIDKKDNIDCYEFEEGDYESMIKLINSEIYAENQVLSSWHKEYSVVYLVEHNQEVFITEDIDYAISIIELLTSTNFTYTGSENVSIHEYPSFEEAYAVALSIKEGETKLCYSSETKDSPYWKGATKSFIDKL